MMVSLSQWTHTLVGKKDYYSIVAIALVLEEKGEKRCLQKLACFVLNYIPVYIYYYILALLGYITKVLPYFSFSAE